MSYIFVTPSDAGQRLKALVMSIMTLSKVIKTHIFGIYYFFIPFAILPKLKKRLVKSIFGFQEVLMIFMFYK